ncbi:unnamed protein product [Cuscuta campestris]|uniref:SWIM-type domain-containing protein n=1 Tax=Cuscuta campestris TaxID=132261 RepID=A0A484KHZ6_9ASTE|nr:unnamed protein product [Cuscuta campestris]
MHRVVKRKINGQKPTVLFNDKGQPYDVAAAEMQSYIGVLARTKAPIWFDTWRQVPVTIKNKIWKSVTLGFDLPPSARKLVLQSANSKWKQFKSTLTCRYILPFRDEPEKLRTPIEDFSLLEKNHWDIFVTDRLSPEFLTRATHLPSPPYPISPQTPEKTLSLVPLPVISLPLILSIPMALSFEFVVGGHVSENKVIFIESDDDGVDDSKETEVIYYHEEEDVIIIAGTEETQLMLDDGQRYEILAMETSPGIYKPWDPKTDVMKFMQPTSYVNSSVSEINSKPLSGATMITPTNNDLHLAHLCFLENCDDVQPYFIEHMGALVKTYPQRSNDEEWLKNKQNETFPGWFRRKISKDLLVENNTVSTELMWIAEGPNKDVPTFKQCSLLSGQGHEDRGRDNCCNWAKWSVSHCLGHAWAVFLELKLRLSQAGPTAMPLAAGNKEKKKKKALKGDESIVDGYGDAAMPKPGGQVPIQFSLCVVHAPTGFRVYVKDKCIVIEDIDWDIYFTKDLFEDVISKAKEQNISLPRFVGFRYHPPWKEIQKEALASDRDWIKMVEGVIDDDKGSSEDEEEDYDFTGSEEECLSSEAVSLDEESEMEDDFDLDADTAHKMMLVKKHHNRAGAAWVATHLLEHFRNNKQMSVVTAQKIILKKFSTRIPDYTCWRALRVMRGMVEGRHEDGYKMLPQYMEGPYEGVLLTAMALDGSNGQFPLAYGVANCEDETEWSFFPHGLFVALGCTSDASPYTIISDMHKEIIKGLRNAFPKAKRRICVLHFYKNFASKFSGAWFHSFFYIVANTFSEYVFKKAMEKIKEEDVEAYDWLMDNEPHEHWARHKFDPALKCDDNTNNFVESFNKAIISHRAKPTLQMLEEIRKLIGNRFEKKFDLGRSWCTTITPYVDNKLRVLAMEYRVCSEVVGAGRGECDVVDGNTNLTVRLRDHHCDCNKWQVSGLPCKHAVRCILRMNENLENYCEDWFSVEKYRRLYDGIIHPIPDPCMWGESSLPKLDPPKAFKKKG